MFMKKQVLNFRKAMLVAALISAVSFSAMAAPATSKNGKNEKTAQNNIQYVGTTDDNIVFNVKYDNADASKFDLVIKNEYGETVYQQTFNDKNFDKKVVLVKEPGDARLTFIIKGADTYKQSFDISTVTRTVEDVVVKKSK
jgi:uncharacterized radical SAM superfamily protein